MSGRRTYTAGVEAALHVLSGGGCYRPGCGEPSIRFVDDEPKKNLEIAHIHAVEENGPRWVLTIPELELNKLPNLLLLCSPCHKKVDDDEERYPTALLKRWKSEREKKPLGSLAGLRDLDKEGMETLLDNAMEEIRQDMAVFADQFPELAALLRRTIEEFPRLDPDSVDALYAAAARLDLPDHAPLLYEAACRLDLPDHVPLLHEAAYEFAKISDHLSALRDAAGKLVDLPDFTTYLGDVSRSAEQTISSSTNRLSETINEIESAIASISARDEPVVIPGRPEWCWKAMVAGWAGWVCFGLVMLAIYLNTRGGA